MRLSIVQARSNFSQKAIAAAVSLRSELTVTVTESSKAVVSLNFSNIGLSHTWPLEELLPYTSYSITASPPARIDPELESFVQNKVQRAFQGDIQRAASHVFLYLYLSLYNPTQTSSVHFDLSSQLPLGSGLGSSASMSVCIATALLLLNGQIQPPGSEQHHPTMLELINSWAFCGEQCSHGNPSGLDNTVATFGSAVLFQRNPTTNSQTRTILHDMPQLPFLLCDTQQPRQTKTLVAHVGSLLSTHPTVINPILDAIDAISTTAASNLSSTAELDTLIRLNQSLLSALGVSHPKLDLVASLCRDLGATKLTGAGGGGCAITLMSSHPNDTTLPIILTELSQAGFHTFRVSLGGPGVGYAAAAASADYTYWLGH